MKTEIVVPAVRNLEFHEHSITVDGAQKIQSLNAVQMYEYGNLVLNVASFSYARDYRKTGIYITKQKQVLHSRSSDLAVIVGLIVDGKLIESVTVWSKMVRTESEKFVFGAAYIAHMDTEKIKVAYLNMIARAQKHGLTVRVVHTDEGHEVLA